MQTAESFLSTLNREYKDRDPKTESSYAYDAMWLLAKGLDCALRDKALGKFRYKNRRFAYAVRNKMKSSNFEGVSVSFCLFNTPRSVAPYEEVL